MAVPFRAKDTAAPTAEFGHADVATLTLLNDATLDESAIDLGDMGDVLAETLAAPKRNNIKAFAASNKATTKIPAINCDIASYALQKSSLVDAARARGGLQREASLASLSSRSTDVSSMESVEDVEVTEEEWN